ncbi:MAG: DNA polymerase III subunit gamma/tau [Bacteroidales bacterium]|nr:DNA polymerase III subunit gamma/tau [Bacteroidales bacterium]
MEQFIVSARKYRPNSFETLLGQENIARTLKNSILRGQLAHAYLFCGPRGVGKTSAARIFAKTINCSNPGPDLEPCGECESCRSFAEGRSYSIHELDAASNNSVDDIRALTDKVRIPPQVGRYSVYIIDEVHMLSQAAFNAFLKTLEEPPAHAIFILATTEKHKILPTILSRCQTYDFNRISIDDMVRNMKSIAAKEGVTMSEEAMHVIAQKADGAMRDALTLFDQTVAFCGKEVTYEQVIRNLGVLDYEYYFSLTENFLAGDYGRAMLTFDEILSKGFNAQAFIGGLSTHFRDLLVCKNDAARTLLELAPSVAQRYQEFAGRCSVAFLFEALGITSTCETAYKQSGNPRLLIEFALMKLCNTGAMSQTPPLRPAVPQSSPARPSLAPEGVPERQSAVSAPKLTDVKPTDLQPVEAQPVEPQTTPQSARPSKPTGLSIKAMMEDAKKSPAAADTRPAAVSAVKPAPDAATLAAAWAALAESEARMPRLSSAISQAAPSLKDKTIHFEVGNLAQQEWIERNCRARMEAFLQKKLEDRDIRLAVDVKKAEETARGMYMPSDKAKFLQETSPEFNGLQKDLGLEIS